MFTDYTRSELTHSAFESRVDFGSLTLPLRLQISSSNVFFVYFPPSLHRYDLIGCSVKVAGLARLCVTEGGVAGCVCVCGGWVWWEVGEWWGRSETVGRLIGVPEVEKSRCKDQGPGSGPHTFLGGGANLMISSSEGWRMMSCRTGGGVGKRERQRENVRRGASHQC